MLAEVLQGKWIHAHDLNRDIHGRGDTLRDREICESVVRGIGSERKRSGAPPQSAKRAAAAIAAGKILAAVRPGSADSQLDAYKRTIDRLLAFVPARTASLSQDQIIKLLEKISAAARDRVPHFVSVSAIVTAETDSESEACHRVILRVEVSQDSEISKLADATIDLHRTFAELASTDEKIAISFFVEIETLVGQEPKQEVRQD